MHNKDCVVLNLLFLYSSIAFCPISFYFFHYHSQIKDSSGKATAISITLCSWNWIKNIETIAEKLVCKSSIQRTVGVRNNTYNTYNMIPISTYISVLATELFIFTRCKTSIVVVLYEKMILKISYSSQENKHLYRRIFFNKTACWNPTTLLKVILRHLCFPVDSAIFHRTPILWNICKRLLLKIH